MLCDCCSNRAPSTLRPKLTRELVCCGALRIGSALSFFPLFPPFFLFGIARIDAVLAEAAAETAAATADALACVDESERKAGDGCPSSFVAAGSSGERPCWFWSSSGWEHG